MTNHDAATTVPVLPDWLGSPVPEPQFSANDDGGLLLLSGKGDSLLLPGTGDLLAGIGRRQVGAGLMGSRAVKRAVDAAGALAMIVLLSPIMLLIAALVAMGGGPVLFGHERLGFGGRAFRCLKFRTMVPNAAEVLSDLLARDPAAAREWATTQKLRNDPRITRLGKFLRKTSLDELPQLWNIVVGEMSLVGPRPIVQSEAERYGSYIDYYYAVRPGLTGLWQVRGRSTTSYAARIEMDVEYVSSRSVGKDIKILFETVPAVLRRSGAF